MIVEGRLAPGERLVEQRLAEELNVSRTPVREAIRRLEAEGLVTTEPNRGAVVRPVSEKDIYDLYELRARLESLAAERAAARSTPDGVHNLDEAIAAFEAAIPAAADHEVEAIRQVQHANRRFHDGLLEMADSPRLSAVLTRTVDIPLVFQAFRRFTLPQLQRSNLLHCLVRDAVAAHESDRAGRLMAEHIYQGRDVLLVEAAVESDGDS